MHRIALAIVTVMLAVGALVAVNRTAAQDATPAEHPLVGSWIITFPDDPTAPPSLYTFGADGTVVGSSAVGDRHGAWRADGEDAAELTVVGLAIDDPVGTQGLLHIDGRVQVDEDGDRFELAYEARLTTVDGIDVTTDGPFRAEGRRIEVESPALVGTPAADGTPMADGTPGSALDEVIGTALATIVPGTPDVDLTPEATP